MPGNSPESPKQAEIRLADLQKILSIHREGVSLAFRLIRAANRSLSLISGKNGQCTSGTCDLLAKSQF
jgi:hypothetical protein